MFYFCTVRKLTLSIEWRCTAYGFMFKNLLLKLHCHGMLRIVSVLRRQKRVIGCHGEAYKRKTDANPVNPATGSGENSCRRPYVTSGHVTVYEQASVGFRYLRPPLTQACCQSRVLALLCDVLAQLHESLQLLSPTLARSLFLCHLLSLSRLRHPVSPSQVLSELPPFLTLTSSDSTFRILNYLPSRLQSRR